MIKHALYVKESITEVESNCLFGVLINPAHNSQANRGENGNIIIIRSLSDSSNCLLLAMCEVGNFCKKYTISLPAQSSY